MANVALTAVRRQGDRPRPAGSWPLVGSIIALLVIATAACGRGLSVHTSQISVSGARSTGVGRTRRTESPESTSTTTIGTPGRTAGSDTGITPRVTASSGGSNPMTTVRPTTTTTGRVSTPTGRVTPTLGPAVSEGPATYTCLRDDQVFVSAHPATLAADGASVATIEASYNGLCHNVPGVGISFSVGGPTCGRLSTGQATAGSDGVARVRYTASTIQGDCVITASVPPLTGHVTIVQRQF